MLTRPKFLLKLEGAAIFSAAVCFYCQGRYHWWLYALLFLAPDLAMVGYLKSPKLGSAVYNSLHTLTAAIVLLLGGLVFPGLIPYALIWISHIGFDRMLGYGLKYPAFFRDTHLQRV
jgi:Domain of unknown function (DUF4260)